jgi:MoxR-like ATPase
MVDRMNNTVLVGGGSFAPSQAQPREVPLGIDDQADRAQDQNEGVNTMNGSIRERLDRLDRLEAALGDDQGPPALGQAEASGPVDGHAFSLNDEGQRIADEILQLYPEPVLLLGGSGLGKSVLARYLADQIGTSFVGVNADEGMRLEPIVGLWRPEATESGPNVTWTDGALTQTVREGDMFLFEEITRAPQELMSKLFGLLDSDGRSWNLIEKGGESTVVHPDFWFMCTGNPSGVAGYNTKRLDRALLDRFGAIYQIDVPLGRENEILGAYVPGHVAEGLLRWATDARSNSETYISTRNLVQAARHIKRGIDPQRAIAIGVTPKYPESLRGGLADLARLHLADLVEPEPEPEPEVVAQVEAVAQVASTLAAVAAAQAAAQVAPKATPSGKAPRRTKREMGCVAHWAPAINPTAVAKGLLSGPLLDVKMAAFTTALANADTAGVLWECNCADCVKVRGHRVRVHDGPQGRSVYQVDAETRRVTSN